MCHLLADWYHCCSLFQHLATIMSQGVVVKQNNARLRKIRKQRRAAASEDRRRAKVQANEWKKKINTYLMKFDTNRTGKLEPEQVEMFVQQLAEDDGQGRLSEPELKSAVGFIMKAADASGDDAIDEDEIMEAVAAWKNWANAHSAMHLHIKNLMDDFDKDETGSLSKEQVAGLLTKLNAGVAVPDDEVEAVIAGADKRGNGAIDMEEMYPALAMWYQMDGRDGVEGHMDDTTTAVVKDKGCCIVS